MTAQTYTVLLRTHKENFIPKFAFNAKNETEAYRKTTNWALYHDFCQSDVSYRIATANEAANWLHNEYIR